ncbi:MAG: PEP-CTERM sorting domain-containing protein [Planctomycetota bacterium]|jgi:hypothetical protein
MRIFAALMVAAAVVCADPVPFNDTDWFQFPDDVFLNDQVVLSDPIVGGFATARLNEDLDTGVTFIENHPGVGDPVIINYAGGPATLEFDWVFDNQGTDALFVDLIDPAAPLPGFVGGAFSLAEFASGSGHVSWDLTGLGFTGAIGFNATFQSFDPIGSTVPGIYDGFATISNLQLVVPPPPPVPEPGMVALLATALLACALRRRR